ncbi:NADPH-dependent F420 reductase [Agromyces sp. NPDC049794]|uniref:NADPH-dependent F420 reductase n=1 Tax=unclassified Agromyces TaxID=2639701 RepID=UPI0033CE05E5
MTNVSIFGTGNMANAIGGVIADGGSTVQYIGEDSNDAPTGDIVVLAVPYAALADIVASHRDALAGKIVVDITNPVNFETFDSLTVPADSSAAAELARQLPDSRVLKAFNTTFAGTLAGKTVGGLPTTVQIAGDDAAAKQTLAEVVRAGGIKAIDVGGLKRARELEAFGFLQITLAAAEKINWTGGFAVAA